jgi:glutathione S-transferase
MHYLNKTQETREPWRVKRGEAALDALERHLEGRDGLVGDTVSVADISLLAYTRVAHEGGFDLNPRPRITAWIAKCENVLGLPR